MKYNVLIVDDEQFSRDSITYKIDSELLGGISVTEADNAFDAEKLILNNNFDVIITDIRMPEKDGIDLIKSVTEANKKVYWIIVSGYNEFEYAREGLRYGVCDYLLKPVNAKQLNDALLKAFIKISEQKSASIDWEVYQNAYYQQKLIQRYNDFDHFLHSDMSQEERDDISNQLGPIQKRKYYQVGVCHFKGDISAAYRDIRKAIILSAKKHLHDEYFDVIFSNTEMKECILLFGFDDSMFSAEVTARFVIHGLRNEMDMDVFVGIGSRVIEFACLKESYKSALGVCRNKILKGYGHVQSFDRMEMSNENRCQLTQTDIDKINYYTKIGNQEKLMKLIDSILDNLKITAKHFNHIFEIVFTINQLVIGSSNENSRTLDKEFIHTLYHADSFEQIKTILEESIRDRFNQKINPDDMNGEAIVRKMGIYIENNTDKRITLTDMADLYHIHPNYLCRIFMKYTGQNFNGFVTETKMKRAMILLKEPDSKVVEVSDFLGYSDPKYFSKVFKKYFGISPSDVQK